MKRRTLFAAELLVRFLLASVFCLAGASAEEPIQATTAIEPADAHLKPGDVFVPRAHRPRNQNSNCVWCACQTCFHGAARIESFAGVRDRAVAEGWRGAGQSNVLAYCKTAGIEVETGTSIEFLKRAVAQGTGAVVFIPGHAVYLCGIDDESARVIDNNGSAEVRAWTRRSFDRLFQWGCFPKLPRPPIPFKPGPPAPAPNPHHPSVNPQVPVEPKPPAGPSATEKLIVEKLTAVEKQLAAVQLKPGPQGEPGPKGEPGAPGRDADAARVAALEEELRRLKEARYVAELLDADGQVKQRVEFGPGQPLRLKLVPVK